ncbi:regulatory particle non-ATPase [Saitoella coloradoensis]
MNSAPPQGDFVLFGDEDAPYRDFPVIVDPPPSSQPVPGAQGFSGFDPKDWAYSYPTPVQSDYTFAPIPQSHPAQSQNLQPSDNNDGGHRRVVSTDGYLNVNAHKMPMHENMGDYRNPITPIPSPSVSSRYVTPEPDGGSDHDDPPPFIPKFPKLDRTLTDIVEDELYQHIPKNREPPLQEEYDDNYQQNEDIQRLINAFPELNQPSDDGSPSSLGSASVGSYSSATMAPPPLDDQSWYPTVAQMGFPTQVRQMEQRQQNNAMVESVRRLRDEEGPALPQQTVSPKEAFLDFPELEQPPPRGLFSPPSLSAESTIDSQLSQRSADTINGNSYGSDSQESTVPHFVPHNAMPPPLQAPQHHQNLVPQLMSGSSDLSSSSSGRQFSQDSDNEYLPHPARNQAQFSRPGTGYSTESAASTDSFKPDAPRNSYACVDCGRRFDNTQALSAHKRTHSGDAISRHPFPQALQGTASAPNTAPPSPRSANAQLFHQQPAHLQSRPMTHSVSHTGSTPSKPSSRSHGPHRCDWNNPNTGLPCNKVFSRPYDLIRHQETIHAQKKPEYKCEICGDDKVFARADALVRHRRVKHGLGKPPRGQAQAQAIAASQSAQAAHPTEQFTSMAPPV